MPLRGRSSVRRGWVCRDVESVSHPDQGDDHFVWRPGGLGGRPRVTSISFQSLAFPLVQEVFSERPGAVKGALSGAAEPTLDGEDRSKRMEARGKARGS